MGADGAARRPYPAGILAPLSSQKAARNAAHDLPAHLAGGSAGGAFEHARRERIVNGATRTDGRFEGTADGVENRGLGGSVARFAGGCANARGRTSADGGRLVGRSRL